MSGGEVNSSLGVVADLRQQAGSKYAGFRALWSNINVLCIALFASFGGLLYGYQQGVLGQALVMSSFQQSFPDIARSSGAQGWLTSILQLGGWIGALSAGVLCEIFSRKHTIFGGALWVVLGSYLTAGARNAGFLYAGRFFTGIGVGTLSATGPLYNAELAPPEIRGLLVAMQQLATTIGIMIAYWICYGTNYIGGTGDGQSNMAWRLPLIIQGLPAVVLVIGVWFLPYSPRLLVNRGRDEDAVRTLSRLRQLPPDDRLVQMEFLAIKAESLFEAQNLDKKFPHLASNAGGNRLRRELAQYLLIFRSKDSFKRVALGSLVMFFQQWSGIDSIIYYAPIVFRNLGLTDNTISLLATGVVGVINVVTTIPAMFVIDKVGRKPLLICGSTGMLLCQLITGVIVAKCQDDWPAHRAAGWASVAMIWLYIFNFAYSWGPASWTLIAEIYPLSIRAKGTSISASSNWMNNFIIAFIMPPMLSSISWGTYIFFCVWCALGGLFILFFFPETKGKTLEEMDLVFGSTTSSEDTAALAAIQDEVGLTALLQGGNWSTKMEEGPTLEHADSV
ncbi:quinate permease [Aspergillus sclerotiicarbonarius CBS 121057]|uniref:Quinate permease n=1 Tax=Aspergillus sclerotiicarbonarius (strain CBS 121057 / IBT 28362) TaxID=1448318 RepID=A0A319F852_ASPSB|nr:quinate permease [Aspergillus sclerotiicarbonarius CBS 121057]